MACSGSVGLRKSAGRIAPRPAPVLDFSGLHVRLGTDPTIDREGDAGWARRARPGTRKHIWRGPKLVENQHRLRAHIPGLGFAAALDAIARIQGIEVVVVLAFDDEGAGHAVHHVDRSGAVLVRMIPMGSRRAWPMRRSPLSTGSAPGLYGSAKQYGTTP